MLIFEIATGILLAFAIMSLGYLVVTIVFNLIESRPKHTPDRTPEYMARHAAKLKKHQDSFPSLDSFQL